MKDAKVVEATEIKSAMNKLKSGLIKIDLYGNLIQIEIEDGCRGETFLLVGTKKEKTNGYAIRRIAETNGGY